MINIIIYEDNEKMQDLYQETIYNFFTKRNQRIKFHIFNHYIKDLETKVFEIPGTKIFILDIEVPGKSGLDLARIIRSKGDWISPLIVVTSYEHLKNTGFTSKVLMLDFISKKENLKKRLNESLDVACDIISLNDSYTFQYNGELYHVNFDSILYFEKDLNDNYTFLYTKDDSYKIKESITQIEKKLKDNKQFLKIHRSCIINIHNVDHIDLKTNTIYLGEHYTNLITKESKEILKKRLSSYQIIK